MTYWLIFNLFQKNVFFGKKNGKNGKKTGFFQAVEKKTVFLKHY